MLLEIWLKAEQQEAHVHAFHDRAAGR